MPVSPIAARRGTMIGPDNVFVATVSTLGADSTLSAVSTDAASRARTSSTVASTADSTPCGSSSVSISAIAAPATLAACAR